MAKTTTIAGNTFLFTGKLTEFTREDAEAHVEAEGGKVLSGVSAKLNYLVVGEDAGSKLAKAEALGNVTIIHEKEFLKMMKKSENNQIKPIGTKSSATEELNIGTQIWMREYLNVETFQNGDAIPEAKTAKAWEKAGAEEKPAWCYYNNDSKNGESNGKLYNCFAANDHRGLAPKGWHIPNKKELISFCKDAPKFKEVSDIPYSGMRLANGTFSYIDETLSFWSIESQDGEYGYQVSHEIDTEYWILDTMDPEIGLSILLLKGDGKILEEVKKSPKTEIKKSEKKEIQENLKKIVIDFFVTAEDKIKDDGGNIEEEWANLVEDYYWLEDLAKTLDLEIIETYKVKFGDEYIVRYLLNSNVNIEKIVEPNSDKIISFCSQPIEFYFGDLHLNIGEVKSFNSKTNWSKFEEFDNKKTMGKSYEFTAWDYSEY